MGQAVWIASATAVAALVVGSVVFVDRRENIEPVAMLEAEAAPEIGEAAQLEFGSAGSAIATAAFGLSALQPETYNSQIVIDIIEASPLEFGEKDRLTAKLMAAEAGHAKLPSVLADIRFSLAVE